MGCIMRRKGEVEGGSGGERPSYGVCYEMERGSRRGGLGGNTPVMVWTLELIQPLPHPKPKPKPKPKHKPKWSSIHVLCTEPGVATRTDPTTPPPSLSPMPGCKQNP